MGLSADRARNAVSTPLGSPIALKLGDTAPALVANLFAPDGTPASLPGTITFRMREVFSRVVKIAAGPVTLQNPAAASVRYDWQAADTSVAAEYEAWFVHTDGARVETFPNQGSMRVRVEP